MGVAGPEVGVGVVPTVTVAAGVEVDVLVGTAVLVGASVGEGTAVLVTVGVMVAVSVGDGTGVNVGLPLSWDGAAIPGREVPGTTPKRMTTSATMSARQLR